MLKPRRSRQREVDAESRSERSIVSPLDRSRRRVRIGLGVFAFILLALLLVSSGGPLLWLVKSAVSTSQDIIRDPFGFWPSGIAWENLVEVWTRVNFGSYLLNTVWIALGSWAIGLTVALTGGYALAILRPRYARAVTAAVLATLFIPGVVSLIPLYLTVLNLPLLGINLVDSFWAVWLPAAANAFNVLLVMRFFEGLPRDLFDAAKIDGAGTVAVFRFIVLPLSKPIIATVSLLSVVAAWREFLWPLLVLPSESNQPISVGLYRLVEVVPLDLQIAGMFVSIIIPIVVFLLFQKQFLQGVGQSGALKG